MPLTPTFSLTWMLTCTILVLPMQAGFPCLETGHLKGRRGGPVLADWETQLQNAFQQTRTTFENIFNRAK